MSVMLAGNGLASHCSCQGHCRSSSAPGAARRVRRVVVSMLRYFLRRILIAIPTLFALITISFFMIHAAPGGPFDANRKATPEVMANLNKAYHLDEPLYEQFGRYVWNVVRLGFGP